MDWLSILVKIALPWLAGGLWVWCALPSADRGTRLLQSIGLGYFLGLPLAGLAVLAWLQLGFAGSAWAAGWSLPVLLAVSAPMMRDRGTRNHRRAALPTPGSAVALILATAGALAMLLSLGLVNTPVVGWDAWQSWLPRPMVWHALDRHVEFVTGLQWHASQGSEFRLLDPRDPDLLPALMYWLGNVNGTFVPQQALLAWPPAWFAITCLLVGSARAAGADRCSSAFVAALFVLTPYPMVQAAIPGYADIWVAGLLLSGLGWAVHWLNAEGRERLMPATGLVLACIALLFAKDGSLLWIVLLLGAGAASLADGRWLKPALAGAILATGLLVIFAGAIPGTAWLPALGIEYSHGSLGAMANYLFLTGDWSFWFWLLPVALAVHWRRLRDANPDGRLLAVFPVAAACALVLVFTITDRAQGAAGGETFNRTVLHVAPTLMLYTLLGLGGLWRRGR